MICDVLMHSCYIMILEASNEAVAVSGHNVMEVREKLTRGYDNVLERRKAVNQIPTLAAQCGHEFQTM